MEDVKDTLWKWAIGLAAMLGMGATCFVFFFAAMYWWQERHVRAPGQDPLPFLVFLSPFLTVLWFRLASRKLWAGWTTVCTMSACLYPLWRAMDDHALGASDSATIILATAILMLMVYALIFKTKLWRGGF